MVQNDSLNALHDYRVIPAGDGYGSEIDLTFLIDLLWVVVTSIVVFFFIMMSVETRFFCSKANTVFD